MKQAVLLLDIGGTNTRARLVRATPDLFRDVDVIFEAEQQATEKPALLDLLSDITATPGIEVIFAVISIAGPVNNNSASITNWAGRPVISMQDLGILKLPDERIILINDMAAAACCITAYREGMLELEVTEAFRPAACSVASRNAILLIPGTGVGLGAVVAPAIASQAVSPLHISCEVQHTLIPPITGEFAELVQAMQDRLGRTALTWEDLISGRGLENLYVCAANSNTAHPAVDAATIARQAVAGTDAASITALSCFYYFCGALAQVMALSFQPFAGIYLGGTTTRQNLSFILQSGFVNACQDNYIRQELLQSFPVYLVPEYMNLNGAMYIAQQSIQASRA